MGVAPSVLRGRSTAWSYEYDDAGRVTQAVQTPAFTEWDHALLSALALWEAGLCPGCGFPKSEAWHPVNEGWYEGGPVFTCHACTESKGLSKNARDDGDAVYQGVMYTRDPGRHDPLPPFPIID